MSKLIFPSNFLWGAATSSYQIEGAIDEDGRGESIWDRFSHAPGNIEDGSNADIACDHYHRWREDIALMKRLGLQAYRFSVSWPRLLPEGRGRVNQAGLDFYQRLVDELLEKEITPFLTLHHWDLPQLLEDAGGWPVRATAEAFVEYTDLISRTLGDRVKYWLTHNEPWCASFLDYQIGIHAPGRKEWPAAIAASHHLLLSHGWAVSTIRQNSKGAEVGMVLNFTPAYAASPSHADFEATRWFDGYFNRWFLEPLYGRHYPADMVADYISAGYLPAEGMTCIQPGDMKAIATQTDFLGVNYYTREVLRSQEVPEEKNLPRTVWQAPRSEWTEMGWELYPQAFYELLARLHFEYRIPKLYVTENGCSYSDGPDGTGKINDQRRIAYLHDHLAAVHRAIRAGAPIEGYFVWSLMDNYEWNRGYTQRFGVVWVDYETQVRLPKESAFWYKRVIEANGLQ